MPENLLERSALELAALVRGGQLRARELTEMAIRRIEAGAALNAFTYLDADRALATAEAIGPGDPRPFAGVPLAVKDLTAVAGQPLTMGSDLYAGYRSPADAAVVRRFKEAGFVLVGRTNTPEFGLVNVTEPRRFGPTRNPWNRAHTPGGSSGGAAAAVAAGMVPVAHGSDGGGSIRIPAACCGLVGLKPCRGRISWAPDLGDDFLATEGVLTRTVADTAALLDVLAGYEPGDATWAPPPPEPFAATVARPPRRLRVALTTESPLGTAVDPACAGAARRAAALLASLGHQVEEVAPADWVHASEIDAHFSTLWVTQLAAALPFGAALAGMALTPEAVEPLTWAFYRQGLATGAPAYYAALVALQRFARTRIGFFARYDVLVTPVQGRPPGRIGAIDTCAADTEETWRRVAAFTPFTAIWNITGQPAISLPLAQSDGGLPIGVQIVGPPAGEGLLLALAAEIESAVPWSARRPPP